MAANPVMQMLGAAITMPGDYTRGAIEGEFGRVTADELLRKQGVKDPKWYQSMGLDMLTDPTFLLPALKATALLGAGTMGMAAMRRVAKELPPEVLAAQAKAAAKKARKSAAREAALLAEEKSGTPLLAKRLSTGEAFRKRMDNEINLELSKLSPEDLAAKGPYQPMSRGEYLQSQLKTWSNPHTEWLNDPVQAGTHVAHQKSLRKNPLFKSRLLESLRAADPNTPVRTPNDIIRALQEAKTAEGFPETELQLLLTRFASPGPMSPSGSAGGLPDLNANMLMSPHWKTQVDIPDLATNPKTIGDIRKLAEKEPPLSVVEQELRNYTPEEAWNIDPSTGRAEELTTNTLYHDAIIPGHADDYAEKLWYAGAGDRKVVEHPSILERYARELGGPQVEDHFRGQGGREEDMALLFHLWDIRQGAGKTPGKWLGLNQQQSDMIQYLAEQQPNDPIIQMLKNTLPEMGMARLAREAAERKLSGVVWHPGVDVQAFTAGKLSGQKAFYGLNWPAEGLPNAKGEINPGRMLAAARNISKEIPGSRVGRVDLGDFDPIAAGYNPYDLHETYKPAMVGNRMFKDIQRDFISYGQNGPDLREALRIMEPDIKKVDEIMLQYQLWQDEKSAMELARKELLDQVQFPKGNASGLMPMKEPDNLDELLHQIRRTYEKQKRKYKSKIDDLLGADGDWYVNKEYAERFATRKAEMSQDRIVDNYIKFAPRWGLHLPPETWDFVINKLRHNMFGLGAAAAGGGTLLAALQAADRN